MTGYHLIKYSGATKYDVGDTSENDFPIFRTAEVFLNYVEDQSGKGERWNRMILTGRLN